MPIHGALRNTSQFFNPTSQPTVVIKVGTSSLIRAEQGSLNLSSLASIVEIARDLKALGFNVIIVSSGAVGVGCQRMRLNSRPDSLAQKQALAAVGQVHLMRYYDDLFTAVDMRCGQVLLTLDNLANRSQYVNAKNTFEELLRLGVVPIVNENDTVAVQELRIGDNDTLSAQVATLVQAEWLFLLTDVPSLFTSNPNTDPHAQPIYEVPDLSKLHVDTSTKGTEWGTGGMATKLTAARIATAAGCRMVICSYEEPRNIPKIIAGERVGTVFHPTVVPLKGRKRWILSVPVRGEVWLDEGAQRAVQERKKSLFSAGILNVKGEFEAQDAVSLCNRHGEEFARALINYPHSELDRVKGMNSRDFAGGLGYVGQEEVCHRANICLLLLAQDDSDHEHDSGQSPYDGPSRSITPPVIGSAMPAIIAAAADAAAAEAAGSRSPGQLTPTHHSRSLSPGASHHGSLSPGRPQHSHHGSQSHLPPRVPMTPHSSGSLASASGSLASTGGSQQLLQQQQQQQADILAAQQQTEHDELAARLAALQSRPNGAAPEAARDVDWDAELSAAIAQEIEEQVAREVEVGHLMAAAEQDINEEGWLPK
ncbi:hypothetical protein D9Q98_006577 [Chlorella vulgaris]|uniref:PUA domain-containing protein n=1 Tax=Chlorella vulgaris TaxID=3077 RepID=A0A9D4TKS1_CHLVU|nr:hypothetical protein D9Q98_006577 [Chlorella vulgaris]